MRISDWSSDVCSSDLGGGARLAAAGNLFGRPAVKRRAWPLALLAPLLVGAEKPTLVPDVSQRDIEIAYSFTGAELLLFGAILYPGGRVPDAKDEPAEVVVVVKGPTQSILLREKQKIAGIWINAASMRLDRKSTRLNSSH